jgi:hypothetical protein
MRKIAFALLLAALPLSGIHAQAASGDNDSTPSSFGSGLTTGGSGIGSATGSGIGSSVDSGLGNPMGSGLGTFASGTSWSTTTAKSQVGKGPGAQSSGGGGIGGSTGRRQ